MTALVSGVLSVMCGFMLLVYPSAGQWAHDPAVPVVVPDALHLQPDASELGAPRCGPRELYDLARSEHHRHSCWQLLMLLHPVLSAVSMSLTIGFYLILLGVDGIVLALSGMGR